MTFREMVKTLQYIRDVLREYLATEERKRAEARKRAEEAAQRRAEEAAAREAEMKAIQERLLAQRKQEMAEGRRRVRRGEGPRSSTPLVARTSLAPAIDPFAAVTTEWGIVAKESQTSGPLAVLVQFERLQRAILELFDVTEGSRAWFRKLQDNPKFVAAFRGGLMGLMFGLVRLLQRRYDRAVGLAHRDKHHEQVRRIDRMAEGDWREKVRYILWTNGLRQARHAAREA
jgi:hypothetical protein